MRGYRAGARIVVQQLPAGTNVTGARRAVESKYVARDVHLIKLHAITFNLRRKVIAIELFPAGTSAAAARSAGKAPDGPYRVLPTRSHVQSIE